MTRETLEVDVLIVGAGPAGLSAALRLAQLQKAKGGEALSIAVIEKAREAGAHQLSGALLDPSTLQILIPDFAAKGAPLETEVREDNIYFLTPKKALRLPVTPPPFRNHGNYIISLNKFTKWLAGEVEAAGIDLFTGFPAQSVLLDGRKVIGVRTGDKGVGRHGEQKGTFEPGADIVAKVTIFADGVRGNLTKELSRQLQLAERGAPGGIRDRPEGDLGSAARSAAARHRDPHARLPAAPGRVRRQLSLRHAGRPHLDRLCRRAQLSGPAVRSARGVPALQAAPVHPPHPARTARWCATAPRRCRRAAGTRSRALYCDGGLIVGDAANFVNSMRLKGIHLAMRSGMLAAETAFDATARGDVSAASLSRYKTLVDESAIKTELYPVRNVHQAFKQGLYAGSLFAGLAMVTGGRALEDLHGEPGHERMRLLDDYYGLQQARHPHRIERRRARSQDRVRQGDQRSLLRHAARRGSAGAPARAHRGVSHDLRRRVRASVRAVLPGERLRDGRRRGRQEAAADQRVQLRPLQDVRHHGPVPA